MEILGYIVQYFHEDTFMPETGYKHLFKTYQHALDYAKTRVQDYTNQYQMALNGPYEYHSPTKKQTDEGGFAVVFRNSEVQIWIEVIVK
jgi:hypothetical protein